MLAVFVCTFHGVMQAIALGFVLGLFALVAIIAAWLKLMEWWQRRKRGGE